MPKFYARWMRDWERKLATRDNNRVVRPFEWGLDWMGAPPANGNSHHVMRDLTRDALADSETFFAYHTPRDYRLDNGRLTFTSPLPTPYPENNIVHAGYFPARRDQGRAVVVLPQWNSDEQGHAGLCRLLNRFGITALDLGTPFVGTGAVSLGATVAGTPGTPGHFVPGSNAGAPLSTGHAHPAGTGGGVFATVINGLAWLLDWSQLPLMSLMWVALMLPAYLAVRRRRLEGLAL